MKKILLSAGALLLVSGAVAQEKVLMNDVKVNPNAEMLALPPATGWLNWANAIDIENGETMETSLITIAQDSTLIMGEFSDGTTAHPFMHAAAVMFDPSDGIYEFLTDDNSYTADSLAVTYGYRRGAEVASSTVDTVIIQVVKHNASDEWTQEFADNGEYTQQAINYDYVNNKIPSGDLHTTIKYPLSEADTTTEEDGFIGLASILVDLNEIPVAAGERIGYSVSIKLGADYGYTLTDSLVNYSRFWLLTSSENGIGEMPNNWETLNHSYILHNSVLYNISDLGWNGIYHPTIAFSDSYFENHDFFLQVTTQNLDIEELTSATIEVSPNPSNGIINITSAQDMDGVSLNVVNLVGQTVMNAEINGMTQKLDLTNLNKGIYLMNFSKEGKTVTKKVVLK